MKSAFKTSLILGPDLPAQNNKHWPALQCLLPCLMLSLYLQEDKHLCFELYDSKDPKLPVKVRNL